MRAAVSALVLAACSQAAGPATFGSTPFASVDSAACSAHFDAFSAPDPLVRGESRIEIATTPPLDGLTIAIVPWMAAMGHGASTAPTVVAEGNGKYLASGLVLAMPGDWQLRTHVAGSCTDDVVFMASVE